MNMILHDNPTAHIGQGNTLTDPKFKDGDAAQDLRLRRRQSALLRQTLEHRPRLRRNDPLRALRTSACRPPKQGDYAYLLHIVRSLKSTGKGACILPHGVLFRGNAEADIRQQPRAARLHQGHHRPARQSLLRHRHPGLHRRARQGRRHRPQGHLHDRCLQGLHEGRPEEPPPRAGHPQDRGHLHPAGRNRPALRPHGAGRGDRDEERLQPQPAALHRQHRAGGLAGHRRPPARRHPRARPRCARPLLEGHARPARRLVRAGQPPRLLPR